MNEKQTPLFRSVLTAGVFLLCTACSTTPLATAENFPSPQTDFVAHRAAVHRHIVPRSLANRTPDDIELNLPFELKANAEVTYRGRFLLFHGLNDSAYVWTDMARALQLRGFDVRAVLLPGHGSHPQEQLNISYLEWLNSARQHFQLWNDRSVPIYLGGFSMGAAIATLLALDYDDIAGLLLFSPAFHSRLNHLLRWSWAYKRFQPWVFGGVILEDNPIKYNSIPINSVDQYYRVTRHLKKQWRNRLLRIPTLTIMSEDDSVVDIESVRSDLALRFTHPLNRVLIYSNNVPQTQRSNEEFRPSSFPELRILNQSHLSLLNAPDNPLFGRNGKILVCNGNEYKVFFACMDAREHWYGAQHTPSPDGVAVARTTYNPDWAYVLNQIELAFGVDSAAKLNNENKQ